MWCGVFEISQLKINRVLPRRSRRSRKDESQKKLSGDILNTLWPTNEIKSRIERLQTVLAVCRGKSREAWAPWLVWWAALLIRAVAELQFQETVFHSLVCACMCVCVIPCIATTFWGILGKPREPERPCYVRIKLTFVGARCIHNIPVAMILPEKMTAKLVLLRSTLPFELPYELRRTVRSQNL